jgi:hypothetical protein
MLLLIIAFLCLSFISNLWSFSFSISFSKDFPDPIKVTLKPPERFCHTQERERF